MIDTADTVAISAMDEAWIVAYATETHVYCCGWPFAGVPIGECELLEKATPEQRDTLLRDMADMDGGDPRRSYAIARLAALRRLTET